jgi:hypothetical protein
VRDSATGWDADTGVERFSIEIIYGPPDNRGTLLKLISVLHRRGIDPLTASFVDSDRGQRCFRATFAATPSRARIVAETLRNVVGVTDVNWSPQTAHSPTPDGAA